MNTSPSPLSTQERDLQLFLDSIGVHLPAIDSGRSDGYCVIKLDPRVAKLLDARDNKAVLLAYRIEGRVVPLSIVFLKGVDEVFFCHSTLLLDRYTDQPGIIPLLRKAVLDFFSQDANRQFAALEPSWTTATLTGQQDYRIQWTMRPDFEVVTDLFMDKLGDIREIPLFPSVYYYNNPYDQNLLEVALPELGGSTKVLVLGSGAGLEAVCIALKYGVSVDATDINPIAVANTIAACRRTGTDHLVRAWVSDGLQQVTESYDAILFEAPLATDEAHSTDPNRYDFGGALLRQVLEGLPAHLRDNGRMYLMSRPDLTPYMPANGLQWKALRRFEAKSSVAIHKIWRV